MYMAYGWPQSIPLDPGDSDGGVVLLRVLGRLLLAVCPASLHLWSASHHKVRLDRSPESLAAHGPNAHAVWSPDAKTVAVLDFELQLQRRSSSDGSSLHRRSRSSGERRPNSGRSVRSTRVRAGSRPHRRRSPVFSVQCGRR